MKEKKDERERERKSERDVEKRKEINGAWERGWTDFFKGGEK